MPFGRARRPCRAVDESQLHQPQENRLIKLAVVADPLPPGDRSPGELRRCAYTGSRPIRHTHRPGVEPLVMAICPIPHLPDRVSGRIEGLKVHPNDAGNRRRHRPDTSVSPFHRCYSLGLWHRHFELPIHRVPAMGQSVTRMSVPAGPGMSFPSRLRDGANRVAHFVARLCRDGKMAGSACFSRKASGVPLYTYTRHSRERSGWGEITPPLCPRNAQRS